MSKEYQTVIRFWEEKLADTQYLLDPSMQWLIKMTINYLKELDEIKDKEENYGS